MNIVAECTFDFYIAAFLNTKSLNPVGNTALMLVSFARDILNDNNVKWDSWTFETAQCRLLYKLFYGILFLNKEKENIGVLSYLEIFALSLKVLMYCFQKLNVFLMKWTECNI